MSLKSAIEEQTALCAGHRSLDGTSSTDVLIYYLCVRAECATVKRYSLLLAGPANKAVPCVMISHILAPDSSSTPPLTAECSQQRPTATAAVLDEEYGCFCL